jgi:1-aminocyclopropane-1-carboxylate deaminase/D-cysteine desulfhydrase-like pyridoxal-dependent ACC family enzyme
MKASQTAMIDLMRKGIFSRSENILFLHSGDDIVLHAYIDDFAE